MKKILLSAGMIVFMGALMAGATGAFFSDSETSSGNTFTAGAIDLLVDSQAHYAGLECIGGFWADNEQEVTTRPDLVGDACSGTWTETNLGITNTFFNLGDLKPGDEGENTISLHVNNNDAYVCAIIDNLVDNDNNCNEPETEDGDVTCGPAGGGELSTELRFTAWADQGATAGFGNDLSGEGDNVWQATEPLLFSNDEGPASDVLGGVSYPLYTPQNGAMPAGSTSYIGLAWCYGDIDVSVPGTITCDGAPVDNMSQTDSMTADISFYVEQSRNNEDFTCPTPEEFGEDEEVVVPPVPEV